MRVHGSYALSRPAGQKTSLAAVPHTGTVGVDGIDVRPGLVPIGRRVDPTITPARVDNSKVLIDEVAVMVAYGTASGAPLEAVYYIDGKHVNDSIGHYVSNDNWMPGNLVAQPGSLVAHADLAI